MIGYFKQNRDFLRRTVITVVLGVFLSGCPFGPLGVRELDNIREDTTLKAGTYIAKKNISVTNGATLTLLPGVKIVFEADRTMSVEGDASLNAVGTEKKPILFTGVESSRGFWGGLRLYNTNSSNNQLEYVTIEYGGGYYDGNLLLYGSSSNPARAAVNHCTFRQSAQYGFASGGTVVIDGFEENTLTENSAGAASLDADHVGFLSDTSAFSGNDADIVSVPSGNINSDAVWPGIDADYAIATGVSVHAALTIEAGAVLAFAAGKTMSVESSGSLTAAGTEEAPVFFTGAEETPGYWGGLRFYNSNNTVNALSHAVFEYAGGYWNANVYVTGSSSVPSRVAMDNCTFRFSKEYGLSTSGNVIISSFVGNVLTENTAGAARVDAGHVGFLDASSSFRGNQVDVVHIASGNVDTDAVWRGIDAPYLVDTGVGVYAALTIEPGAALAFAAGRTMSVESSGSLAAVGTNEAPVFFTGAEEIPGYWGGLRFYNSNTQANVLTHCVFEYGGGYWDGNLYITGSSANPARVAVTACAFENSLKWGISLAGTVDVNDDIATANTFANNAGGDIRGL
ncbi:MAG TPA: hypothetical protein ENN29_00515 [Candidatus Hydrogenedentes bacterium]|nr:hypothetical protein [Candidatus Hydrogenedentota bacterium]